MVADLSLRIGAAITAYRATPHSGSVQMGRYQHVWLYACLILVMPVTNAAISPEYPIQSFRMSSRSQVPALVLGDLVLVDQRSYRESLPRRGDLVVFRVASDPSTTYVERIIGLPGERIQMRHGNLYINDDLVPRRSDPACRSEYAGIPVASQQGYMESLPQASGEPPVEHCVIKTGDDGPLDNTAVYQVPPNHYFGMGDNRDNSADSRVLSLVGYILNADLIGRVEMTYWPLNRLSPSVNTGAIGALQPAPDRQSAGTSTSTAAKSADSTTSTSAIADRRLAARRTRALY
jgi:signal peptidase I